MDKVIKALDFATKMHKGQKRKLSGESYILHPIAVYEILSGVTNDEDVLCAALLHDVVEDCHVPISKIKKMFGPRVADIVNQVSHDKDYLKCGRKVFDLRTREGLMVKLADTLHNISSTPQDKKYVRKKLLCPIPVKYNEVNFSEGNNWVRKGSKMYCKIHNMPIRKNRWNEDYCSECLFSFTKR